MVTGEAPVIETTRAEGVGPHRRARRSSGLPNNGRNFLDFTKLTPGVTIVQGPDGDELIDQRPEGHRTTTSRWTAPTSTTRSSASSAAASGRAFTFNLDAVKEVVVVAEGANAEFGRSSGGFVNVVTKSGTNEIHGTAHVFFKNDGLSSRAEARRRHHRPTSSTSTSSSSASPSAARSRRTRRSTSWPSTTRTRSSTKQTDPARIEQRVVDFFASLGSPNENGPIERTNDARVFLGKIDWQLTPSNLLTLRYNYTWSEQENGTFDVDSWGRSANAIEKDYSHAVTGSLISSLSRDRAQRVPLPVRARVPAAALRRARTSPARAGRCPTPRSTSAAATASAMPFFIPVDYYDTAHPAQQQPLAHQGPPRDQGRGRVQPGQLASRPSSASRTAATSSAPPTAS